MDTWTVGAYMRMFFMIVWGSAQTFNALHDVMENDSVGFRPDQLDFGDKVMKSISEAVWYIDPHLEVKLKDRGLKLPDYLAPLKGFNDPKSQKRSVKNMSTDELESHSQALNEILLTPWSSRFPKFSSAVLQLSEIHSKYSQYLLRQRKRCQERDESMEPLRSPANDFTLKTVDAAPSPCSEEYDEVYTALLSLAHYTPLSLTDFEPENRYARRHWMDEFKVPTPVNLYTYSRGSCLGNLNFVWSIPESDEQRSESEILKAVQSIHTTLPVYSTRAMRHRFFDRYQSVASIKPAIMRDMYRFLTRDASAAASSQEATIDDRLLQILADADEPDLMLDMRSQGSRTGTTKFQVFWDEMDKYFNETLNPAVNDRRHGEVMYLPAAISLEDLHNQVKARVAPGSLIPSIEWMRLQFWPKNPTTVRAIQHTGRFQVKFTIQQRLLRSEHEDKKFCLYLFRLLKQFAVKHRNACELLFLDDKAVIPVGQPDRPVSTGVRGHNSSLQVEGSQLLALDHDFHICGIVPSVVLRCDIPASIKDSFFTGGSMVTLKDKIFQPSSPIRHAAETIRILCPDVDTALESPKPILLNYTDGGPDHRTTYGSVQVAGIAMFIALDLDMYVTARTHPGGSYINLAERVNANLNYALQNVSSARAKMSNISELKLKNSNTMSDVRKKAEKDPKLKDEFQESMKPVVDTIASRLRRVKLKGVETKVFEPASEEFIREIFQMVHIIDTELDSSKLTGKDLNRSPRLLDFMSRHCRKRHYIFQIMKCHSSVRDDCWYCSNIHPPRLPDEIFDELHFVPDPVLNETKDRYKEFDEVYGKDTTDNDRPSKSSAGGEEPEADVKNKSILVGTKVRGFILCGECKKPRCIYSASKLNYWESVAVEQVCEEGFYTCGSPLFDKDSETSGVIVRESNQCNKPVEVQYYAGKTATFPEVCYYCGYKEDLVDDDSIKELKRLYSTVRPICVHCKAHGFEPATRGAKNVGKRQRTQ